jgi:DNA-binding transcriptional LysR family regulator
MIDVRRLRVLREVAMRSSITAAAAALEYTPSAVSQQIATLERETGVTLLERRGRGVVLTPSARALVKHTDVLLAQLERAEAELAIHTGRLGGTVRLGAFATAMHDLVPRTLAGLAAVAPDIAVHVTEVEPDEALPALVSHVFDLVLAFEYDLVAGRRVDGLHRRELLIDQMLAVGVPAEMGPGPVALEELADEPWLLPPEETYCGQLVRRACEAARFQPKPTAVCNDFRGLAALADAGLGVALVPTLALTPEARRGATSVVPGLARRLFTAVRDGSEEHPVLAMTLTAFTHAAARPTPH